MKRSVINTTLAVAMLLCASSMFATTVGSVNTNNVTANVIGGCAWVTPLTMNFGNYDPTALVATTQTAALKFKCVKKTNATDTYKVWFNKTAGNMISAGGPDLLPYTLVDNATNNPLATTAATATTVAGVAGVAAAAGYNFTVKGTIAIGQDVSAYGIAQPYQDTVVANIEY
jgi:spore coat protein U-like protein